MEQNESNVAPRENGHNQPSEPGDSIDWSAIDSYRDQMSPTHDEEWTIRSISRRFKHGQHADDVVESPINEEVTLGDPHWYVTCRRDRFPALRSVTAEYEHHVFPDIAALEAWFGNEDTEQ